MGRLGVRPPTLEPKATEHMEEIIRLIRTLVEKGVAYRVNGDVYFEVQKYPGYGRLSKRKLDELQAGARVEVDERKRNPMDFALWKSSKPGEPAWPSPWGPGRPGWHIECSAMAMRYLGPQLDIHGGGADLAFPHHTCEIAQSEHFTGKAPFSRFWMHTGMVHQDGEKMSKSLGKQTQVSDLLKNYSADAIRVTLLNHHYRYPCECISEDLEVAMETVGLFQHVRTIVGEQTDGEDTVLHGRFKAAMENDLN